MTKSFSLTLILTLSLSACAGRDRGPERPVLSPERRAELAERFTRQWDHDRDGVVTCADLAFERAVLFTLLDTDNNEELASAEYRYAKFEDKSFLFHLFDDVDTDHSGAISLQELQNVSHSQFASVDRDGNCIVSEEEAVEAAREQARTRREGGDRQGGRDRGRGGRGSQRPNGATNTPGTPE